MKKTLCGQEKFLSVQLFLLDRKLRCISYQAKKRSAWIALRRNRICRKRPAAGGESCVAGFYFIQNMQLHTPKNAGKCSC